MVIDILRETWHRNTDVFGSERADRFILLYHHERRSKPSFLVREVTMLLDFRISRIRLCLCLVRRGTLVIRVKCKRSPCVLSPQTTLKINCESSCTRFLRINIECVPMQGSNLPRSSFGLMDSHASMHKLHSLTARCRVLEAYA